MSWVGWIEIGAWWRLELSRGDSFGCERRRRDALQLSEVTAAEMAELAGLIKQVETRLKAVFDYRITNYLMPMMVDHHVRYHLLPRYDGPRRFAGVAWLENGWPAFPSWPTTKHEERPELLLEIQNALRGD